MTKYRSFFFFKRILLKRSILKSVIWNIFLRISWVTQDLAFFCPVQAFSGQCLADFLLSPAFSVHSPPFFEPPPAFASPRRRGQSHASLRRNFDSSVRNTSLAGTSYIVQQVARNRTEISLRRTLRLLTRFMLLLQCEASEPSTGNIDFLHS